MVRTIVDGPVCAHNGVVARNGASAMQALVEMLIGFIAMLAAAALSQFGVNLDAPHKTEREVHRVHDCRDSVPSSHLLTRTGDDHDC